MYSAGHQKIHSFQTLTEYSIFAVEADIEKGRKIPDIIGELTKFLMLPFYTGKETNGY